MTTATSTGALWLRGAGAVLAGLVLIFVASHATDHLFHVLEVYPPWGQPMHDPAHNLLAFSYRSVYAVLGCYVAAKLAPRAPMAHAMALGGIGLVFGIAGAVAATQMDMGPLWYPVALVLSTVPLAWLGGRLAMRG